MEPRRLLSSAAGRIALVFDATEGIATGDSIGKYVFAHEFAMSG